MGFVFDLLTSPMFGGPLLVHWLTGTITEAAEQEFLDEGRVRASLVELQQRYEAGELDEEAYDQQESGLLERLNAIRELKAQRR